MGEHEVLATKVCLYEIYNLSLTRARECMWLVEKSLVEALGLPCTRFPGASSRSSNLGFPKSRN